MSEREQSADKQRLYQAHCEDLKLLSQAEARVARSIKQLIEGCIGSRDEGLKSLARILQANMANEQTCRAAAAKSVGLYFGID